MNHSDPDCTRRCNRPGQEVAPPGLSLPARLGGATAPARRWHRLGSVSKRDWAVQPPLPRGSTARAQVSSSARRCNHRAQSSSFGREVHQPELSFELWQVMQPPSSDFELCQVMQPPSSVFELCQVMEPSSSVFELWQREAIGRAQSSSSARRCHLSSREVQPPDPRILGFDRFDRFELEF